MDSPISLNAGDHAVQFGYIGQIDNLSISGVLKVEIASLTGSTINLSSPNLYIPPTLRLGPLRLMPRPFPLLVGRQEEVRIALDALPYEHSIEFYGSTGVGKTALLRYLSHHPAIAPVFTDGIIYHRLRYRETVSDALQILFDAFYESKALFKATSLQIRQALVGKKALVILDGLTFTREDIDQLLNELPDLTFLFAACDRCAWSHAKSIGLRGLALNEAIALVTRSLGYNLNPSERADAEKLCTVLEGHPLRILESIAWIQAEKQSLAAAVQQLTAKQNNWKELLLTSLSKPQRWIIALLAAMGANVSLGAEIISGITNLPNVQVLLETLLQRNLIEIEGGRVRLTISLLGELQKNLDLTSYQERTVHFLTQWVQQHQNSPDSILQESDAILRALEWAIKAGQWSEVLVLGRSIEGVLALSGRWGTWETVLQSVLEVARATGDQATEAFALHELGTRSLCLNQVSEAQSYLLQALQIRESIGDHIAIEATTHNLQFLKAIPPIPPTPTEPVPQPPVMHTSHVSKGALIGGVTMLCLTFGFILSARGLFLSSNLSPQLSPIPTPSPVVTAEPDSEEGSAPVPVPDPAPDPVPDPAPVPAPDPVPVPAPDPVPVPAPDPVPDPAPAPDPDPVPDPAPTVSLASFTLSSPYPTRPNGAILTYWGGDPPLTGVLRLSTPAPAGGVNITITSDDPYFTNLPSVVQFEAGQQEQTFNFSTLRDRGNYPEQANTVIRAVYGGTEFKYSVLVDTFI